MNVVKIRPRHFFPLHFSVAWQGLIIVATSKETEAQGGDAVCLKSPSKEGWPESQTQGGLIPRPEVLIKELARKTPCLSDSQAPTPSAVPMTLICCGGTHRKERNLLHVSGGNPQ